jgi:hypothetical protein
MKKFLPLLPILILLLLPARGQGGDFQPYPGARQDEAATRAAREAAAQSPLQPQDLAPTIYLTPDPFEKVAAFYRGRAREYKMPPGLPPQKLPGGREFKVAFFIFDGAKDLMTSRHWLKVQRPYVGDVKMSGSTPQFLDIREVTVINLWSGK